MKGHAVAVVAGTEQRRQPPTQRTRGALSTSVSVRVRARLRGSRLIV